MAYFYFFFCLRWNHIRQDKLYSLSQKKHQFICVLTVHYGSSLGSTKNESYTTECSWRIQPSRNTVLKQQRNWGQTLWCSRSKDKLPSKSSPLLSTTAGFKDIVGRIVLEIIINKFSPLWVNVITGQYGYYKPYALVVYTLRVIIWLGHFGLVYRQFSCRCWL